MPWLLSARTPQALTEQAERLAAYVRDHPELRPADIGLSLATTRTAFAHRLAVAAPRARNCSPRWSGPPVTRAPPRPAGGSRCCSRVRVRSGWERGGSCTPRIRCSRRPSTRCVRGSTVSWTGR
ncbi:hypothetical protein ACFQVA_40805 [Actinomadura keratinilytica]